MDSLLSRSATTSSKNAHQSRPDVSDEPPRKKVTQTLPKPQSNQKDNNEFKDSSYPRELLNMITPYECQLCDVQFTATIMGKMHYTGKKHLKKVRQFMDRWSFKHGKRAPRLKELKPATPDTSNPEYCEYCNVEMLTLNEKILHISGKKHLKNINNPEKICQFSKKRNMEDEMVTNSTAKLWCKPCKLEFFNEPSMEEHKQTLKHKLCLLNQEKADPIIPGIEHYYCMICKAQYKDNADYTAHLFEEKHTTLEMNCGSLQNDLFYCTVCSFHMPQEEKDQHMNGRDHRKRLLLNKTMVIITEMASKKDNTLFYRCEDCPDAGSMNFITFNNHLLSDPHVDNVLGKE